MSRLALILVLLISFNSFSQKDNSLAKVQKLSGRYVFINCEPVSEYEVAFEFKAFALNTGNIAGPTKLASFCMSKAIKESKKLGGKEFDAIVVGQQKYDIAIKFKD